MSLSEKIAELKETYTAEEAKELIDGVLSAFGEECKITFRKKDAEIIDSYKVNEKEVRLYVCEIIARTGLTGRTRDDLSAEWELHNASWHAHVLRRAAKDVSLDYNHDPRTVVRAATFAFKTLNLK